MPKTPMPAKANGAKNGGAQTKRFSVTRDPTGAVGNALTGENVRVNAVCPGLTETPMVAEIFKRAAERVRRGDFTIGARH